MLKNKVSNLLNALMSGAFKQWLYSSVVRKAEIEHLFNGTNSHLLFVVDFDTRLVWELLLLPSNAQNAPNLPSLKGNRWRPYQGVISAV